MKRRFYYMAALFIGASLVCIACGDDDGDDEECIGFCIEEGASSGFDGPEERIAALCEQGCEMEEECFGTAYGGSRGACVEMCVEEAQFDLQMDDEECLEAELEAAECFVSQSCDEIEEGGMACTHKWDEADEICGHLPPSEPDEQEGEFG